MKKLLFLTFFIGILTVKSQIPNSLPNTYINDLTGKLTKDQLYTLNDSILAIEKRSSIQIAILLIPELPVNMVIEDYARNVGNEWKVGKAKNGVVYVASMKEHKQRLEIAQNLEGDLPDVTCLAITDHLKPYFRSGDFYGGLQLLVAEIGSKTNPVIKEQHALLAAQQEKDYQANIHSVLIVFKWIAGILIVLGLSIWIFGAGYRKRRRLEEEEEKKEEERQRKIRTQALMGLVNYNHHKSEKLKKEKDGTHIGRSSGIGEAAAAAVILSSSKKKDDDDEADVSYKSSSSSNYDSSSSSSSDNSSSFGSFDSSGGGGFSGGGASNDW